MAYTVSSALQSRDDAGRSFELINGELYDCTFGRRRIKPTHVQVRLTHVTLAGFYADDQCLQVSHIPEVWLHGTTAHDIDRSLQQLLPCTEPHSQLIVKLHEGEKDALLFARPAQECREDAGSMQVLSDPLVLPFLHLNEPSLWPSLSALGA